MERKPEGQHAAAVCVQGVGCLCEECGAACWHSKRHQRRSAAAAPHHDLEYGWDINGGEDLPLLTSQPRAHFSDHIARAM